MCLHSPTQGPDPTEQGEGYKVFAFRRTETNALVGSFSLLNLHTATRFTPSYQPGEWLTDPNSYKIYSDSGPTYQPGTGRSWVLRSGKWQSTCQK
jgi:hypothetical protein